MYNGEMYTLTPFFYNHRRTQEKCGYRKTVIKKKKYVGKMRWKYGIQREVNSVDYIIDDRTYTPDPREPGTIYIIAQKRGKNGNTKKTVALRAVGGAHTVELIERLRLEMASSANDNCHCSRVTISIAAEPDCEVIESERDFLKIVKKMMK